MYVCVCVCVCVKPVDKFPPNGLGFHDARGNVWQWTEDHLTSLTPFRTSYLYDDYSTSFFDGCHNVMAVSGTHYIDVKTCRFKKTRCKGDKSNTENSTDHFCEDTKQPSRT